MKGNISIFERRTPLIGSRGSRRSAGVRQAPAPVAPEPAPDAPLSESSFDQGLRQIRETDPRFDPTRIAGYIGMVFRTAQGAWMAGDLGPLKDRVTSEMFGAMQAQCDRLRSAGRASRVADVEITATVTEAWQESGRDYVTAHVSGSMIDYTVDEARGSVVEGSSEVPRAVEEFWTFTRVAGLNFWMLSAIQT